MTKPGPVTKPSPVAKPNLVIALDTASDALALAVGSLTNGVVECLASADQLARREANVRLVPTLDALLTQHGFAREQLACVVCGRGPGSFTGVRIAVATAKGLACGLELPLYGVATPNALAWQAWTQGKRGRLAVLLDAMRGEVYPARYRLDEKGAHREDPLTVIKAERLATEWQGSESELTLTGDALAKYGSLFGGYQWLGEEFWRPTGSGLLKAFEREWGAELTQDELAHNEPAQDELAQDELAHNEPAQGHLAHGNSAKDDLKKGNPTKGNVTKGNPAALLPLYTRLSDAEEGEWRRLAEGGQIAQGALTPVPASGRAWPTASGRAWSTLSAQDAQGERLVFRPAAQADLPAMAALEAQAYGNLDSATGGECWSEGMLADELGRQASRWWVCYCNDELAGFVGGQALGGQMHVLDLAVGPALRRRGVARALVQRLVDDAANLGLTELTLEVRESNQAARALYARLGLVEVGRRVGYYAAPAPGNRREDALILTGQLVPGLTGQLVSGNEALQNQNSEALQNQSGEAHQSLCQGQDGYQNGGLLPNPNPSQNPSQNGKPLQNQNPNGEPLPILTLTGTVPPGQAQGQSQSQTQAQGRGKLLILAIESSCDETAVALINGAGGLESNVVASQIDFHERFGGVVPEIASRKHTEAIYPTVLEALAGHRPCELDAVAVTYAPGLIGALVVGMAFAKGLCWGAQLPLIKVHHLEGHIYANRFATPAPEPPFVSALLSGGNTLLVHVQAWGSYRVLGSTLDDAVGEAYDKVAKALGLGYPGGPVISQLAAQGNPRAIDFPRALLHSGDYSFSLSGLKTAVLSVIRQQSEAGTLNVADLAASFEQAVFDVQVAKALKACESLGVRTFCLGGGVAANRALRAAYRQALEPRGISVVFPPALACTDNAAMIAAVALDRYRQKRFASLADDAAAHANLEEEY